jgi:hypothetical protein
MKMILDLGILAVMLLLMMTVGMSSEARRFQDLVRRKAALVGQIVLLPVIGVAVTRGLALPRLVAGIFRCDNLHGQNPHPRRTVGSL